MRTLQNIKKGIKYPKLAFTYFWIKLAHVFWLNIPASQFWEDLILSYLIRKEKWFYVDIGANDPCFGNNTYYFYQKGWNGITVEPNKQLYKRISTKRKKGINLNIAVWEKGTLTYYEMDCNGMSTCDREIVDFYETKGHKVINTYETIVMPLNEVLDIHCKNKNIDIMSIDVEGMDMEVLKSNNREKYKPHYIVLETLIYISDDTPWKKDEEQYTQYLKQYGYEKIADTYVNTIYKLNS